MDNPKMKSQPATVNMQAVIQILTSRISALTLENAVLQARVIELEGQKEAASTEGDKDK